MESRLPPVVLGAQLAAARAAEQERVAKGNARVSPIGPGMRYDFWSGQLDLSDPVRLPLDEALAELSRRYANSDTDSRRKARLATGMDDFYTLLTFSKRAAVFAMRERQPHHIADGLAAIAMIELRRTDPRDLLPALGVLYAAAARIDVDVAMPFRNAAELAEPEVGDLIKAFLSRPADQKQFGPWGYEIVETSQGPGLIRTDWRPYMPTCPLPRIAMDLAQLIGADRYQPGDVTIASNLPPIWLSGINDQMLREAIQAVVAGANVDGSLRPNEPACHELQKLFVFLVEAADELTAQRLLQISRAKAAGRNDYSLLGVCHGRLFCLVISARPTLGRSAFETQESIQRFAPGIERILKKYQ